MAVTDTGYRIWQGVLRSPLTRWFVIARTGIELELRKKNTRRLIMFSWAPILYCLLVFFAISWFVRSGFGNFKDPIFFLMKTMNVPDSVFTKLADDPSLVQEGIWTAIFFTYMSYTQMTFSMLIAGVVGANLICNDSRGNSFLLYFSRPITPFEYFLGKFSTVAFFIFCTSLFPSVLLYILSLGMAQSFNIILITFPVLIKILGAGLVMAIPASVIILFLSSLFRESRFPLIMWFAVLFLGLVAAPLIELKGSPDMANVVCIPYNIRNILIHLFNVPASFAGEIDDRTLNALSANEDSLFTSLASLSIITLSCFGFLMKKIKAPLKI